MILNQTLVFVDVPGLTVYREKKTRSDKQTQEVWFTDSLKEVRKAFCERWDVANPCEVTLSNPQAMNEWLEMVDAVRGEGLEASC